VRERADLDSYAEAEGVCHIVLSVIGERLGDTEVRAIGAELPARLRTTLEAAPDEGDVAIAALFAEVGDREGVPVEVAAEHTQVVCEVLYEALDDRLRDHLASLASPLADLFRRSEPALSPGEGPLAEVRLDDERSAEEDPTVDPDPGDMARRWLHDATEDE